MKQDMIVILDLGSHENTVLARAIRALGVYSEIYPHDITVEERTQTSLSPIAFRSKAATTELSTPPDRANRTFLSPT